MYPATRAGLYAMKPNVGAVPLEGAMPVNPNFDVHGGFAKSPQDLADLLEVMMARPLSTPEFPTSWEGFRVGFLEFKMWRLSPNETEEIEAFDIQTVGRPPLSEVCNELGNLRILPSSLPTTRP